MTHALHHVATTANLFLRTAACSAAVLWVGSTASQADAQTSPLAGVSANRGKQSARALNLPIATLLRVRMDTGAAVVGRLADTDSAVIVLELVTSTARAFVPYSSIRRIDRMLSPVERQRYARRVAMAGTVGGLLVGAVVGYSKAVPTRYVGPDVVARANTAPVTKLQNLVIGAGVGALAGGLTGALIGDLKSHDWQPYR